MYEDVRALISEQDRRDLEDFSSRAGALPGDYLEVGPYQGASTLHILAGMPADRILWCSDYWGRNYPVFRANMLRHNVWHRLQPVTGDFRHVPRFLPEDQRLAFIFVDNDHTWNSTCLPVLLFWPFLQPGGYMLFHDYGHPNYPGVADFLRRFAAEPWTAVAKERNGLFAFTKVGEVAADFIDDMQRQIAAEYPRDMIFVNQGLERLRECLAKVG